ncbi:unnamed protein product, partial [marine sediment metagenome]
MAEPEKDYEMLNIEGVYAILSGELEKAIKLFEEAIKMEENCFESLCNLGKTY